MNGLKFDLPNYIEFFSKVVQDKGSLRETNSLFIFFLTHGLAGDELCARDGVLKCNQIWMKFIDCEELKGKPKMFVFQVDKFMWNPIIFISTRRKLPTSSLNQSMIDNIHVAKFQACKGSGYAQVDHHHASNTRLTPLVHFTTFIPKHIGMDMLILFATIEGICQYLKQNLKDNLSLGVFSKINENACYLNSNGTTSYFLRS